MLRHIGTCKPKIYRYHSYHMSCNSPQSGIAKHLTTRKCRNMIHKYDSPLEYGHITRTQQSTDGQTSSASAASKAIGTVALWQALCSASKLAAGTAWQEQAILRGGCRAAALLAPVRSSTTAQAVPVSSYWQLLVQWCCAGVGCCH